MLVILINWLYIGITTFLTGYAVLGLFARLFECKIRHMVSYVFAGLAVVTVYAQFFSLFSGVGAVANILLCLFCAVTAFCGRKELKVVLQNWTALLCKQKWRLMVYVVLILLMAYGTSRGYMHFDTGLYHAQSIRWIEEYGVVPGLGNLQSRFGYNSAAFSLTALYSMKAVFRQSLHTTAGFFSLVSSFLALDLYGIFSEKKLRLSDFARLGLVFYLSVIFSEMMSPASDYYAMLLLFDILILWLAEDEYQKEKQLQNPAPYGLLCILMVYAVTIKFSVAPLLLLVIKPAVMLLKKKDIKQITVCLLSGFLTAVPFFARNVIISGWLIYPSTLIDLFSVDWKIPKAQADYDAAEIGVYGKGMTDATLADTPISEWLPPWFGNLKSLEKVFVLMTVAAVVIGLVYLAYRLMVCFGKNKIMAAENSVEKRAGILWSSIWDFPFVFFVFTISALFWFFSAPLIRYGYAYVVALPLITFGFGMLLLMEHTWIKKYSDIVVRVFGIMVVLFLLTRVKGLGEDIARTWQQPYYLRQMDYEDGEAVTQVVDGVTFYVPTYRAQIGYDKFPSSLLDWPIELRGDSIEDGFRQIEVWK